MDWVIRIGLGRRSQLVFGTLVNPFLFLPLAFDPDVDKRTWYRALVGPG